MIFWCHLKCKSKLYLFVFVFAVMNKNKDNFLFSSDLFGLLLVQKYCTYHYCRTEYKN